MADLEKKPPLYYVALNTLKAYEQGKRTQYRKRQHEEAKKKKQNEDRENRIISGD